MNEWRVVVEDGCPAPLGLAVDEALVDFVAAGAPPTVHLYTFRPAVIVGRFQDVYSEVEVEECRRLGIDINRRTTGGGAILMSEGCLGLAFVAPLSVLDMGADPDAVFSTLGNVLALGLRDLGLAASYRPKNDIEVGGRKIAGIGADLEHDGLLLFHASTLVDFDSDLMLRVLKLPSIKIGDKAISSFKDRITTVKRECGPVPMELVRSGIVSAFSAHFGVAFSREPLTGDELRAVQDLAESKYSREEWVYLVQAPKRTGQAAIKTAAGLVRVSVSTVKGAISSALIHGDFFASEREVYALESALRWKPLSRKSIQAALEAVDSPLLARIGAGLLADVVYSAGLGSDDGKTSDGGAR